MSGFLQYQVVGFIFSFGDLCHSAPLLFLSISEPIFLAISNDVPEEFFINCDIFFLREVML